ncbi:MAG TPA: glycine/sarcosine/betaine reductase complex component C subunit beta [Candidatus Saccharimonadia bacterium]|nr:glycine/sarcosine/betaine reductase complex component C subunit beta [Candidatus Saccharimonadia bacterium]
MTQTLEQPVIRGVRFFLAHTPGLVRYGSKPSRDIARDATIADAIAAHLRSYEAAVAYPPNRAFLGHIHPDTLAAMPQPWFTSEAPGTRWGAHGEIMPEEEFYGVLKICDVFDLVHLEAGFVEEARAALATHPLLTPADLERLGTGFPDADIVTQCGGSTPALPLYLRHGRRIGCMQAAHEEDASLAADVLLENLTCKASAVMAMRTLLAQEQLDPLALPYVLNSGEEAVGDRYQRGGGNLAKAIAEMCGCQAATGVDIKGFCCGPVHALTVAGSLVSSRVFSQVAVVGGCALAKLGMKYRGHLQHDQPILEDVLAAVAIIVSADDGVSPRLRLDALGRHTVAAGSSQKAIFEHLVSQPLECLGLHFTDVDKYATELHNPEVTEPAGSGNVPQLNYRVIAGLAAMRKEITPAQMPAFVTTHGMPGFSPTQGHIASAVPFLGHAVDGLRDGSLQRVMLLAKGSLFLGRMTQMADGMSLLLERNTAGSSEEKQQ